MNRYDNYTPEIPQSEEIPAVGNELNDTKPGRRRGLTRNADDIKSGAARRNTHQRRNNTNNEAAESKINEANAVKTSRRKKKQQADNDESLWQITKNFFTSTTLRLITGIILGSVGIYLTVAFFSYFSECIHDQAEITNAAIGAAHNIGNKGGELGARFSEFLINETFGLGSFVIIVWLLCMSLKLLLGIPKYKTLNFTIKCLVALITVSLIVGVLTITLNSSVNWGGYHGRYVNEMLMHYLGWTGAVILCLMCVAIFFVICLRDFVKWIIRKKNEYADRRREAARIKAEKEQLERERMEMRRREAEDAARAGEGVTAYDEETPVDDEIVKFDENDDILTTYELEDIEESDYKHRASAKSESKSRDDADRKSETHLETMASGAESDAKSDTASDTEKVVETRAETETGTETASADSREIDEKGAAGNPDNMIVNVNTIAQTNVAQAKAEAPVGSLISKMYKFPSAELLRPGENKVSVDELELEENKQRIRDSLLYHKIPIVSIEATVGPTITLYEVRPDNGIKIARIKNLADDIALSLAATGVRIIAPIPGKGTVGIEVANNDPQVVSMRTIIQSRKYAECKYKLPVAIGTTIGNEVYIADLAKMPHLLIAGATGQGKSVGMNAILTSLLYKKRPDEMKLVMIDPKEVEFTLYAKIEKHYLAKIPGAEDAIVTDMSKVVETLSSLCVEMDNRYKKLRQAKVRNIEEYNAKIADNQLDPAEDHHFLPYIVLVVDEFADLIMTSGKEVETPIARLAQKGRAAGMHAIIATQRPSTNVITGIIKANFPVRVAFKVTSGVDSKTILDTSGAQHLIGRGDMLISSNSQMVRVQCAFVDTPEVEEICDYIAAQPFNAGPYILPEPKYNEGGDEEGSRGYVGDRDPLFEDAARYVVGSGTASTSALQRHFSLGYNRAGKIMDQLEHHGFVGPASGGKPRELRIDMIGLEHALENL